MPQKRRSTARSAKSPNRSRTQKTLPVNKAQKTARIVKMFFEMLNTVKLYHWKTYTFSQHQATDELYKRLNEHIDKFVEILLGKDETRIKQLDKKINLINTESVGAFKTKIYQYREFLIDMTGIFSSKTDSDLLNVRDEILGDLNQFLYLLTFK